MHANIHIEVFNTFTNIAVISGMRLMEFMRVGVVDDNDVEMNCLQCADQPCLVGQISSFASISVIMTTAAHERPALEKCCHSDKMVIWFDLWCRKELSERPCSNCSYSQLWIM